jgi:UDP-glucose 4-epimerase
MTGNANTRGAVLVPGGAGYNAEKQTGVVTVNLGTGRRYTVLQILRAFEKVTGKAIPHQFVKNREGDPAVSYADPGLAEKLFGWRAQLDLEQMCRDTWRWQKWCDANVVE